ncbi:hypothetical protein BN946_scf185010.g54 [Trametes cinnabarina]|uniref:Uncharacterized protein n=1 Tax=Pycnoporus cinnabarinus TaxID=5643 RepID=A0A060SSC8_PYCCI|nr:hypothetical protein BN946_scf185010.g54 [Trametes cinnabarina]
MLGDAVVNMPSDLRPTAAFELDPSQQPAPPKPSGLARLTVEIPSAYSVEVKEAPHPPPRWHTLEFMVYYVIFILVVPVMFWIPYKLSSPSHPNYPFYETRLSPGWMFGRQVDDSDNQYRSFRSGLPSLIMLASAFILLKPVYGFVMRSYRSITDWTQLYQIPFLVAFSTVMLLALHGASAFKVLFILSVNYAIAKTAGGSKANPILTWLFNVLVLFAIERNSGFTYALLHPYLASLDTWKGVYPRWYISFNITMLRLVSFNMDHYWACVSPVVPDKEGVMSEKERRRIPHPPEFYSFLLYIAYVLYPPLYIAGPIMTFNDFMWQMRKPLSITHTSNLGYLLRFVACILTLEAILHFMYVVAIKDTKAWVGYSAAELCMLLVPWRFFRLWALLGGIDPPENMVRCMANNYSTLGFWHVQYGSRPWYRHVAAMGAVFNILMMMTANLIGFVVGTDGMKYMLHQVIDRWEGIRFLLVACACLFVGVQIMFEYRTAKKRPDKASIVDVN